MGWVRFFLGERRSRLYPHILLKFGRDPNAGSKKLPFKFISRLNQKEFRIATFAMFMSDLNAGVVPQMSPPPHDLERLRTTMVDFILLSIQLVFMVLGVSYSRVLAQRPTGCCSASDCNAFILLDNGIKYLTL